MSEYPHRDGTVRDLPFRVLAVIVIFSSLVLAGCATSGGPLTAGSSNSTLVVSPSRLDFGAVTANSQMVSRTFTVTNVGTGTVRIEKVGISPSGPFMIRNWSGPISLAPGHSFEFVAAFVPQSTGNFVASIALTTTRWAPSFSTPSIGRVAANSGGKVEAQPATWVPVRGWNTLPLVGTVLPSDRRGNSTVTVTVSPTSLSLQAGQSAQFTATVSGGPQSAVTWTSALGTITSSGLYTAPRGNMQGTDKVSAISTKDPSKYATAEVSIRPLSSGSGSGSQGGSGGVYSVTNQQPVTKVFYPNTLWTTPLPFDVMNHLSPNSDAIVQHIFGGSDNPYEGYSGNVLYTEIGSMILSTSSNNGGFYYATAADPVFHYVGTGHCPPDPKNCLNGKYFHAPAGAAWDAAPVKQDDMGIVIWDQSTDIDPTTGGRLIQAYSSGTGLNYLPANCTARTPQEADQQPACTLSGWGTTSVNFPFNDPIARGDGIYSDGAPQGAYFLREQELVQGQINHALGVGTGCLATSGSPVFPATGDELHCSSDNLRPNSGSLFFIDSGYNCDAPSGAGYVLPAWQRPVCHALQNYGAYIHSTTGNPNTPLTINPVEGGYNYYHLGLNDPFWGDWIIRSSLDLTCPVGSYPKTCDGTNIRVVETDTTHAVKAIMWFMNMPGLITGHHLHIADPCIARRMAGAPGAC